MAANFNLMKITPKFLENITEFTIKKYEEKQKNIMAIAIPIEILYIENQLKLILSDVERLKKTLVKGTEEHGNINFYKINVPNKCLYAKEVCEKLKENINITYNNRGFYQIIIKCRD